MRRRRREGRAGAGHVGPRPEARRAQRGAHRDRPARPRRASRDRGCARRARTESCGRSRSQMRSKRPFPGAERRARSHHRPPDVPVVRAVARRRRQKPCRGSLLAAEDPCAHRAPRGPRPRRAQHDGDDAGNRGAAGTARAVGPREARSWRRERRRSRPSGSPVAEARARRRRNRFFGRADPRREPAARPGAAATSAMRPTAPPTSALPAPGRRSRSRSRRGRRAIATARAQPMREPRAPARALPPPWPFGQTDAENQRRRGQIPAAFAYPMGLPTARSALATPDVCSRSPPSVTAPAPTARRGPGLLRACADREERRRGRARVEERAFRLEDRGVRTTAQARDTLPRPQAQTSRRRARARAGRADSVGDDRDGGHDDRLGERAPRPRLAGSTTARPRDHRDDGRRDERGARGPAA